MRQKLFTSLWGTVKFGRSVLAVVRRGLHVQVERREV